MSAPLILQRKHLEDISFIEKLLENSASAFQKEILVFILNWVKGQQLFSLSTSGSTGAPKIIQFTRQQLLASAELTIEALNLRSDETALICLDTRYVAGKMMTVRCLANGMNIVAIDPCANPLSFLPIDQQINFAAFVPYQMKAMLREDDSIRKINRIDKILVGGAALDTGTINSLQQLRCSIFSTYGMTETLTHVALQKLNGNDKKKYFKALKGITFSVDERNCLCIEVPHLSETVVTNDIVELIDNTRFIWLGRWDNVINSGAIKIIPELVESNIEKILRNAGYNQRFFIAGLPDEGLGEKVVLLVEQEPNNRVEILMNTLKENLAKYDVPKEIYFIKKFIETDTQKIDRNETLKLISSRAAS